MEELEDETISFKQMDLNSNGHLSPEQVIEASRFFYGETFKVEEAQEATDMADYYGIGEMNF